MKLPFTKKYFDSWEEAELYRQEQEKKFKKTYVHIDDDYGHRVFPLKIAKLIFPKNFRRTDYGKARS